MMRVVGLPGDTIEIRSNGLHINGNPATAPASLGIQPYLSPSPEIELSPEFTRPPSPFTVPENEFYVLGDNVENALDSRYWGTVPIGTVHGKVMDK